MSKNLANTAKTYKDLHPSDEESLQQLEHALSLKKNPHSSSAQKHVEHGTC